MRKTLVALAAIAVAACACDVATGSPDGGATDLGPQPDAAGEVATDAVTELPGEGTADPAGDPTGDPATDPGTDPVGDPAGDPTGDPSGDPIADTPHEVATDLSWDGEVPSGCCLTDEDCAALGGGVCIALGQGPYPQAGTCEQQPEPGRCWKDDDCAIGKTCLSPGWCPCGVDCDMAPGPGVCGVKGAPCTALKEEWILEYCDAASTVIWDGAKCVATCPGCCECGSFCGLTFDSLAQCQDLCTPAECVDKAPLDTFELTAAFPGKPGPGGGEPKTVYGDADVTYVGPPEAGLYSTGTQYTFHLATGDDFKLAVRLPGDLAIPLAKGDTVRVYAKQEWPWWIDLVVVLWFQGAHPLFFGHAASHTGPWWDCGGEQVCPYAAVQPADCDPVEMTCGKGIHPPVFMMAQGGLSSSEPGVILHQGETADGGPGYTYGVATAYSISEYLCADYPTTWLGAFMLKTFEGYKLQLSQDNPQMYEFYELCIQKDGIDPEPELKAIDPTIYCGVAGAFAKCSPGFEVGCHGDLDFVGATKQISAEKWAQLKKLSLVPWVTRIAGGFWL